MDTALNFMERNPIVESGCAASPPSRPARFGGVITLSSCLLPEAFDKESAEFSKDLRGTPLLVLHGTLDKLALFPRNIAKRII